MLYIGLQLLTLGQELSDEFLIAILDASDEFPDESCDPLDFAGMYCGL